MAAMCAARAVTAALAAGRRSLPKAWTALPLPLSQRATIAPRAATTSVRLRSLSTLANSSAGSDGSASGGLSSFRARMADGVARINQAAGAMLKGGSGNGNGGLPRGHGVDDHPSTLPPPEAPASAWHPQLGFYGCALKQPQDFLKMAERTVQLCDEHVARIERFPPSLRTLELTDEISNLLCSVIDVANVCQGTHPSAAWRDAATEASSSLSVYMTSLNHHAGLYRQISAVCARDDFRREFSPEAQRVATTLKEEMDSNGIGAPRATRQAISDLLQEIQTATQIYMEATHGGHVGPGWDIDDETGEPLDASPEQETETPTTLDLHTSRPTAEVLNHLPPEWRPHARVFANSQLVRLPIEAAEVALGCLPTESLRRQAYVAHFGAARLRIPGRALERVLKARQKLAALLKKDSFADFTVSRCVAGDTKHVQQFLRKILQELQTNTNTSSSVGAGLKTMHAKALAEKRMLQRAKWAHLRGLSPDSDEALTASQQAEVDATILRPWDEVFYRGRLRAPSSASTASASAPPPSHFFTVPNVLEGFKILLAEVFRIEARQVALTREEDWTRDVPDRLQDELVKFELWEETPRAQQSDNDQDATKATDASPPPPSSSQRRLLGVIYLDLYARPSKHSASASFNIRSSRQNFFDPSRPEEALSSLLGADSMKEVEEALPRQVPVAGIVCSLPRPQYRAGGLHASQGASSSGRVTLLGHSSVEMLFHELGHCLHNVLSLTRFQHVAGARGELDFVEMPSTLFEGFVDPSVGGSADFLRRWARHYNTGQPIPNETLQALAELKDRLKSTNIITQASMALFDQRFYGEEMQNNMQTTQKKGVAVATSRSKNGRNSSTAATLEHARLIWQDIERQYSPFQPESTGGGSSGSSDGSATLLQPHPYLLQMHLLSYGASYYCYLYCRVFASLVWQRHFAASPLSASAGEQLRRDLFAPGGAIQPADILRKLAHVPQDSTLQQFVQQQLPNFLNARNSSNTAQKEAAAGKMEAEAQTPPPSNAQHTSKGA